MPNLIKHQVEIDLQGQDERKEQLVVVVVNNLGYISVAVVTAINSLATTGAIGQGDLDPRASTISQYSKSSPYSRHGQKDTQSIVSSAKTVLCRHSHLDDPSTILE